MYLTMRSKLGTIADELAAAETIAAPGEVAARLGRLKAPRTALASADAVRKTLSSERWTLLGVAIERAAAGEPGFAEVVASLRAALATDEFAAPLEPAVAKAYADAVKLIGAEPPPPPPPPPPPGVSVVRGEKSGLGLDEARGELDRLCQSQSVCQPSVRTAPRAALRTRVS